MIIGILVAMDDCYKNHKIIAYTIANRSIVFANVNINTFKSTVVVKTVSM